MAKKQISERQKVILQYVVDYIQGCSRPPTIREIGRATEISSTSVVNYNLNRLQDLGFLDRAAEVARGIQPTNKAFQLLGINPTGGLRIPLVGNIVAGSPIDFVDSNFAIYDEDQIIEVGANVLKGSPTDLFALKVSGDSMIDAMVNDGDIVILRKQDNARNGDMIAAWITPDDTTTLKYYYYEGEQVRLQPANKTMQPIFLRPENIRVQGKVELVIRYP